MSALSMPAAAALVAVSAGAVGYVLLAPLIAGGGRAGKRRKAMVEAKGGGRGTRTAATTQASRRDQVAQTLKELEAKDGAKTLTLEKRIAHAGLDWTRRKFYVISAALGVAVALVLLLVVGSPLAAVGGLFAGSLGLPRWILSFLKKKRIKKFVVELPNAMDVIVRGIRAGLPVADCLRIIAREAQEPVRSEFRLIVEGQALGISLADSCAKLYERVPVTEASFFAIVIGIQTKSGGNLSEALSNLSRVLRERRKMAGKIAAMSMEAKASAAIIAAMPFIVALLTYFSSPQYVSLLWTTQAGKIGLMASAVWMGLGITVMKRMISFDI